MSLSLQPFLLCPVPGLSAQACTSILTDHPNLASRFTFVSSLVKPTGEESIFQPAIGGLLELASQPAQPHLHCPITCQPTHLSRSPAKCPESRQSGWGQPHTLLLGSKYSTFPATPAPNYGHVPRTPSASSLSIPASPNSYPVLHQSKSAKTLYLILLLSDLKYTRT